MTYPRRPQDTSGRRYVTANKEHELTSNEYEPKRPEWKVAANGADSAPRNFLPSGLWELAELPQFVGWEYAPNPDEGKPKKPPVNPRTRRRADHSNPQTWGTFAEAERAVTRYGLAGTGFVFTPEDPYGGVDLDDCRNPETGELEPQAERVVRAFDSYAEVSPSGTGVKIIFRGRLPKWAGNRRGKIEIYDRDRYFALTGMALEPGKPIRDAQLALERLCRKLWPEAEGNPARLQHSPTEPLQTQPVELEDSELLERARAARNGRKFSVLYDHGETKRYGSPSEADMDLCGLLAFWTNRDADRMDQLFRRSALMRPKWEREDYRRRTIERAIAGCKSGYAPRPEGRPDVLETIGRLKAFAARAPWTGRGGPADRRAFGVLLNTGGALGRPRKGGIEVSIAQRDIAPDIGRTRTNAAKSLRRLEDRRLIKILDPGNAKRPARILIRWSPKTGHIENYPPKPPPVFNMDRLGGLLFKVRNPAPEMPEYDRNGRRIPQGKSPLLSPLGGLRALILEKVALSPVGLTAPEIAECLERRPDKIKPLLPAILEAELLEEDSGVYRASPNLLERLELELERSGCFEAEERDRRRYERDREARRKFVRENRRRDRDSQPDGHASELEKLSDSAPAPAEPERASAPDAPITDADDSDQLRQLAALARQLVREHRRERSPRPKPSAPEKAAHLLRRFRREDPEYFSDLRSDLRKLAWELSGRGWTQTVYCGNTLREALELLEPERVAV